MRITSQRGSGYAIANNKKLLYTGIAAVLIVAILIGGALAWTDFTQSKTNKFRGTADADVTLHDEFDGVNKDVFVENSGTSTIYVRIRLDEYMQIGEVSLDPAAKVKDKSTWMPHTYDGDDITECGHVAVGKEFHEYYKWDMSGEGRNFRQGTPGLVYSTLGSDGAVDTVTGTPTAVSAPPILLTKYITLKAAFEAGTLTDPTNPDTIAWKAVTETGCWILDNTPDAANGGGWAYWSKALAPDTATNLLLDKVEKTSKEISDDWYYGIDVKLQAVTKNDLTKWFSDGNVASDAVRNSLIKNWQES